MSTVTTISQCRTFIFHYDAGHGWLQVETRLINELDVVGISEYSYMDSSGSMAYLEEDCDAGKFLDVFKLMNPDITIRFHEVDDGYDSFIRNLPRYREGGYVKPDSFAHLFGVQS